MKKSIKSLLCWVVIATTAILYTGCANKTSAVNSVQSAAAYNGKADSGIQEVAADTKSEEIKVNVTSEFISEETESLSVDMQIPVLNGHIDKAIETKLNSMFKNDAVGIKASLEKDAKAALEDSKNYDIEFRKYLAASSYKVYYNRNEFLSLVVTHYIYTGGAHGMSYVKGYNIDLKTGKDYSLQEIFEEGYDYKKVIDEIVLEKMKADRETYFEEAITNFKGITKNHPYYIENGNLVVYFGEYEIAPYAAGLQEFRIPFSALKFSEKVGISYIETSLDNSGQGSFFYYKPYSEDKTVIA